MDLPTVWFFVLAAVWALFFMLEGFDFGVAALLPIVARDATDRKVALNTIGPHWDANEVFLLIAGAGTFAAFPSWYATLFSAFYLPLLAIVVLLILRAVAFEWRGKVDSPRWGRTWTSFIIGASWLLPFLWGFALSQMLWGIPIGSNQEFTGGIPDLISWYAVLGGGALMALCLVHGANFLTLRADGAVRERARAASTQLAPLAAALLLGYAIATTSVGGSDMLRMVAPTLGVAAAVLSFAFAQARREALAFTATLAALGLTVMGLFGTLYPNVLVSRGSPANSLTVANSSSGNYTLTMMTIVTAVLLPIILLYTAWAYRVFRRRLSRTDFGADEPTNPFEFAAGMLAPRETTVPKTAPEPRGDSR